MFVANTLGQRHPTSGKLIWLHRILAKFSAPWFYFESDLVPRAWTHMGKQGVKSPWSKAETSNKHLYPPEVLLPHEGLALVPIGDDLQVREVGLEVGCDDWWLLHLFPLSCRSLSLKRSVCGTIASSRSCRLCPATSRTTATATRCSCAIIGSNSLHFTPYCDLGLV